MRIAILAGSNRAESTSTKLCRYIARLLREQGHEVDLFDLYEKPVPFYSKDPALAQDVNLQELKRIMLSAAAIVLSSPEYHGSMTGLLKNGLDHLGFDHFDSKAVLAVSSTGGAVATSTLQQLQVIVRNVHGVNCPEWISIGGELRAFDDEGVPVHASVRERTLRALGYFVSLAEALTNRKR